MMIIITLTSWPIGSPSASSYAHADYNVDDLYPLHVHCMRTHDEHVDDVSRQR